MRIYFQNNEISYPLRTMLFRNRRFQRKKEKHALRRSISCHLTISKSIQSFRQRDPFPPLHLGEALFPADVLAVTVSRSSPRA